MSLGITRKMGFFLSFKIKIGQVVWILGGLHMSLTRQQRSTLSSLLRALCPACQGDKIGALTAAY